ncbi:hypothetical protein BHE74_00008018 [Ensete ventricosum]|nr:hypothetical protein BHE74_00008018 [Ensete ventricosum]
METIIPSLVTSSGLCPDRVGGPEEPLVSDLEENLYLTTSVSAATYWFACCNISGTVDDGRSINDQTNMEGWSPIKNALITSEGWASGISRSSAANRLMNRASGSSLPCVRPRSDAAVGLERELTRKLSSNSFARESKEEMDDGLSRLYHIRVGPLRVVGKAWHISESEVS